VGVVLVACTWWGADDVGVFRPGAGGVGSSVFELRFLGPVQAVRAGRDVPLGGPRQRALLALLALDPGRVVSAGRLVEELWRGRPPLGAAKTLRSFVSRLRSALAPEVALLPRGGGYVLNADPGQLDVARFERLVADFNRDSDPDLAVTNVNQSRVSVLLGSTGGTFTAPTNFPAGSTQTSVVAADFNGDGKPDLAATKF
jgi:DNA-binding winged helix-turn-helix (wHTH) protein